jgi:glycosyltransferase involved in cell wall biosynthesis
MCSTATALGVFPGPQFREVQETRWAEKALQINNVIPETGDEPASVSEPPHILFLGRINHAKGADDVLQVFLQLANEGFDDLRLTIAGSGDLERTIRERAQSSSYASRISVPGFVKGRELQHIRSEANIFALPSPEHDEGFPLAFLECAERGMACIATINSALPDVFAPGEEFIAIDGSQPGELYDALRNVVAHRSERRRLGHAIQNSVRNRFTVSSATGRFANLYARVRRRYSAG